MNFVLYNIHSIFSESSIDISLNWENDGIPMAWSLSFSLDSAKELFEVFTSQTVSIIGDIYILLSSNIYLLLRQMEQIKGEPTLSRYEGIVK